MCSSDLDENKINVNRDFINSNVGFKNHHIPNIDMRKFDGKDPNIDTTDGAIF